MLLNDVIIIMKSLLNKDLQEVLYLLKNKNINYAYDIASIICDESGIDCHRIKTSKRHNKYNNSYIYLAIIYNKIVECKLYQVNKEQIYVVTTLQKHERDNLWATDINDIIYNN